MSTQPIIKPTALGGLTIRNTRSLINAQTKLCVLAYARAKHGKTTMGASLDKLTQKYSGKPTLFIAVEAGDGGGTMSIRNFGVDYVIPEDISQLDRLVASLATDTTYGGVVVDSSTELASRVIKPYAMKFPSKQHTQQRTAGVPEWGDYQLMGEKFREIANRLIALTCCPDERCRKHLFMTALLKERTDESGNVIKICPDLPGAMADTATAMFQTVGTVDIRTTIEPNPVNPGQKIRTTKRVFTTSADGVKVTGDRTHLFPPDAPVDLCEIYEKYWIPEIEGAKNK